MQPHTFCKSTKEVVFKNSKITLNIHDPWSWPDVIELKPKRLFSYQYKTLRSACLYWDDYSLYEVPATDVISNPIQSGPARPATRNSSRARAELSFKSAPTPQLIPSPQYDLRRRKPAFTRLHSTLETTRARAEPRYFKPIHKSLPKGVFLVDEILGSKKVGGIKHYLIK